LTLLPYTAHNEWNKLKVAIVDCHVQVGNAVNAVPEQRAELWMMSKNDKTGQAERCEEVWLVRLSPTADNVAQVAVARKTSVEPGATDNVQLLSIPDYLVQQNKISSRKVPWAGCAYTPDADNELVQVKATAGQMLSKACVVSKKDLIASKMSTLTAVADYYY
jgi:hypothetical protein